MLSRLDHSHELAADFEEVIISDSLQKSMSIHQNSSLWKDVTQILRRISNALPTVYYLTLLYVVPFCFFPFHLCYLYFFRQYIHFHVYFIKSGSQFISALLVKGIVFCCCSCYCSYILLFCLFYSFVPIQLRESATLFHPRIKEI